MAWCAELTQYAAWEEDMIWLECLDKLTVLIMQWCWYTTVHDCILNLTSIIIIIQSARLSYTFIIIFLLIILCIWLIIIIVADKIFIIIIWLIIYHWQIFDRLASSIGQDVLDSFYYVISVQRYRRKDFLPLCFYSTVAAGYICILTINNVNGIQWNLHIRNTSILQTQLLVPIQRLLYYSTSVIRKPPYWLGTFFEVLSGKYFIKSLVPL